MYEHVYYEGGGKFVSHGEWLHPARTIQTQEIIFVLSGTVYITEGDTAFTLQKNDLLFLDPEQPHRGYRKSTDTSFYWLHFTGNVEVPVKHQTVSEPYNLTLLFKQLLHYRTEAPLRERLDYITRLIVMECLFSHRAEETNRIAAEAAAWIAANRDVPLKAEEVAAHFGYNPNYLCRLFKACYGQSLKEYIDTVRLDHIKSLLLTTDMPLAAVATAVGFSDYKYFLKFFKYHEGITPTEFLKGYAKTHINKK